MKKLGFILLILCLCLFLGTAFALQDEPINNKDDFLRVFNNTDGFKYAQKEKNIILNADISVTSDELFPDITISGITQTGVEGLELLNTTFNGNGHTITITKGTKDMYPLFRKVYSYYDNAVSMKDLKLVYNGDVIGSACILEFVNSDKKRGSISNIDIKVNGSILPIAQKGYTYYVEGPSTMGTINYAVGLVKNIYNLDISNINIDVSGDIGKQEWVKYPKAENEAIFSIASGLLHKVYRSHTVKEVSSVDGANVKVAGGIYGFSKCQQAIATGMGYEMAQIYLKNASVKAKEIIAKNTGDLALSAPYAASHDNNAACGIAYDIYHVENVSVDVGTIQSENRTDMGIETTAIGIGFYSYLDGNDSNNPAYYAAHPMTVKNVKVNVDKMISLNFAKDINQSPMFKVNNCRVFAGFGNALSRHYDNNIRIDDNVINVNTILADTNHHAALTSVWGWFKGKNNIVDIGTMTAKSVSFYTRATGFSYEAAEATNNSFTAKSIVAETKAIPLNDSTPISTAAGFGYIVHKASNNTIKVDEIKSITTSGKDDFNPKKADAAGYANFIMRPKGDKEASDVHNESVEVKLIESFGVQSHYIGGFAGYTQTTAKIYDNKLKLGELKVDGSYMTLGGFIGDGFASVYKNTADIEKINVLRNPGTMADDLNNQYRTNTGGFVGRSIKDSADNLLNLNSFNVVITKEEFLHAKAYYNPNVPPFYAVGGFAGMMFDQSDRNEINIHDFNVKIKDTEDRGEVVLVGGFVGLTHRANLLKNRASIYDMSVVESKSESTLECSGFVAESGDSTFKSSDVFINKNLSVLTDIAEKVSCAGFVCATGGDSAEFDTCFVQIDDSIKAKLNAGGVAGFVVESSLKKAIFKNCSVLIFGDIDVSHTGSYVNPHIRNNTSNLIAANAPMLVPKRSPRLRIPVASFAADLNSDGIGLIENCAAYVQGKLMPGNDQFDFSKGAIISVTEFEIKGFSCIVDFNSQYKLLPRDIIYDHYTKVSPKVYYVEEDGDLRRAYNTKVDATEKFEKTNEIGSIKIVERPFQYKYWDKAAELSKNSLPYNFPYYTDDNALLGRSVSTMSDYAGSMAAPANMSLKSYYDRHMFLLAKNEPVIFDILGIKSSKLPEDTPTPSPTASPSPTPSVTPSPTPSVTPSIAPTASPTPTLAINQIPQTGDTENLILYIVVALVSIALIALIIIKRKR